ncbi:DUF1365 domain-containing protein [Aliidiomarina taiwanensis]|uniref:DUF1365 domain-containing protein n=1 Tax=Aliidiomarina taiwanensis TaxID=946228 RepID=A0A432XAU5_9GAMM|nr:DUF1365 domain-containing protein [Aliidiomarina taiwanensis]
MTSRIYWGSVRHRRFIPKEHSFRYHLMQWGIALEELEQLNNTSKWFSTSERWAPLHFKPSDYLPGYYLPSHETLSTAVLRKMNSLSEGALDGQVFFLGNIRTWGLFFSPLNCYFLINKEGIATHMLAEVSNTPWNQRHYYLVNFNHHNSAAPLQPTEKNFHVSPFNPMEMQYHWRIRAPGEGALIHIEAHRKHKEFDATLALKGETLNRSAVYRVLRKYPMMSIRIIGGIYWQALRLFLKRVPLYGHSEHRQDT